MHSASFSRSSEPAKVAPLSATQLTALVQSQAQTITALGDQVAALKHPLEWFKRQVFGSKSERFAPEFDPTQMHLGEGLSVPTTLPESLKSVPAHTRRLPTTDLASAETVPVFDESRVPVETITVIAAAMKQLAPEAFEVIGEKVSYRLAQRPGSFVVLKYVRPLIKRLESQTLLCAPAPVGVLEGSRADVSFIADLLVDKFAYHLPLYRQHQRLTDAGITVSRPWLTQLAQRGIGLLEPIYDAQFASIQSSRVKAMDETPIKAGRSGHGNLKTGYFWPVYGQDDEVCFPFFPSRSHDKVRVVLGLQHPRDAVLISAGYAAYQRYAEKTGLTHAQCWAHARRTFFEAQASEPVGVAEALEHIQAIYKIEADLREHKLTGEAKQHHRLTHSKPTVEAFFAWVEQQMTRQGFSRALRLSKR